MSAELLSTWANPGEENLLHHKDIPTREWVLFGGDIRTINLVTEEGDGERGYRHIFMQRQIEGGVKVNNLFWIAGSYGQLSNQTPGPQDYYVLIPEILGFFSLRAGKFNVNYGVNHPDHTAFNRSKIGLGQGNATHNVEVIGQSRIGEISITGIQGSSGKEREGGVLRLNYFAAKTLQIGASGMYLPDSIKYGAFSSAAYGKWLHAMIDVNQVYNPETTEAVIYSYGKASAEVYRGINLFYENNYSDLEIENGGGFQWFPRPHLEFIGKLTFKVDTISGEIMCHYFL